MHLDSFTAKFMSLLFESHRPAGIRVRNGGFL
jgi:hypothetical protein